ncbi:hypothetical protein [Virgibacillus profundi]|uniref:hypothetical protein n=1 Tax=Virgibacillus profundi TaxID=2024555 RepID=UPI0013FD4617|nr:hypothetical protein [Virgibacillus profundi]
MDFLLFNWQATIYLIKTEKRTGMHEENTKKAETKIKLTQPSLIRINLSCLG